MQKLLFTKKVDKSLLKEGLTIPLDCCEAVQDAVGAHIAKGSFVTVEVVLDGTAYPAKFTHLNFSVSPRDMYQIRYAPGSDLRKVMNLLFGAGTGVTRVAVYAGDRRQLFFFAAEE